FFCIIINSCASISSKSKDIPAFIAQEADNFYIHLIFDHIPNYLFLLDDVAINPDIIQYQKIKLGHLIKVPVSEHHRDFKVKTSLRTYLHKEIKLVRDPKKLMMIASFSKPVIDSITQESPDLLMAFSPPETQYYRDRDFLKNPIFFLN